MLIRGWAVHMDLLEAEEWRSSLMMWTCLSSMSGGIRLNLKKIIPLFSKDYKYCKHIPFQYIKCELTYLSALNMFMCNNWEILFYNVIILLIKKLDHKWNYPTNDGDAWHVQPRQTWRFHLNCWHAIHFCHDSSRRRKKWYSTEA